VTSQDYIICSLTEVLFKTSVKLLPSPHTYSWMNLC